MTDGGAAAVDGGQLLEREAVLVAIADLLDGARAGRGGALFVVGEAGLGKTTCLEQATAQAAPTVRVGLGRGDVMETSLPFGMVTSRMPRPRCWPTGSRGTTSCGRRHAGRLHAPRQCAHARGRQREHVRPRAERCPGSPKLPIYSSPLAHKSFQPARCRSAARTRRPTSSQRLVRLVDRGVRVVTTSAPMQLVKIG
ncbi:MAG: ATP-binding protein [Pseudonocardiales bacterium]|nr:ATP-binding protein [Pseudonocardiales bacterium]